MYFAIACARRDFFELNKYDACRVLNDGPPIGIIRRCVLPIVPVESSPFGVITYQLVLTATLDLRLIYSFEAWLFCMGERATL